MTETNMIMVGAIMGAHGVRGQVKIKTFIEDPASFATLSPVHFGEDGPARAIISARVHKQDILIATLADLSDRDAAQALKSTQLFVSRDTLGVPEDDADVFKHDLEGLAVRDENGRRIGIVKAVQNFGASDVLEITLDETSASAMVPFIEDAVPHVDVAGGYVVIEPAFMA